MGKRDSDRIISDIKSLKVQGATNIAIAGVKAYFLNPSKTTMNKLLNARCTEPALFNALSKVNRLSEKEIIDNLRLSKDLIAENSSSLFTRKLVVYTHCHSSCVIESIIKNKSKVKKVVNTETRPLFQGRKTAKDLVKAGISVDHYVDSAMFNATSACDIVFLGSDAITPDGVYNKVGSYSAALIAKSLNKPVYVLASYWKFVNKIKIEHRDSKEVWPGSPKKIKVHNPAFDFIPKKLIKGIISEFGVNRYSDFLEKIKS